MTDQSDSNTPGPNPDLRSLDRLVGTWEISGDATGEVTYTWLDGGFFLLQRFQLTLFGHTVRGIEVIGHLQPFGEQPSAEIRSRAYDDAGNTLDYVYELADDALTIWGGERGSKSFFRGQFSGGDECSGAWEYEGGGGYSTTMRRCP